MLRRQSVTVVRLSSSHITRPRHYYRHQPLSVRTAARPTTRASHHPTNLPQLYPKSPSPSRRNSTLSSRTTPPSRRMRFVRRFIETVLSPFVVVLMFRLHYQVFYLELIITFKPVKLLHLLIPLECPEKH
jgi:hypothetical protein